MVDKARSLCGTGFQLHGRDSDYGLDCIGLAEACLQAADIDCQAPNGYALRSGSDRSIARFMADIGFVRFGPDEPLCEGDLVLARPSPVQWHFLIRAGAGFVHAHAGLGQVVFSPGESPWPIAAIFRLLED